MEQSTLAWWWYGNDEDSFLMATFRNITFIVWGTLAGYGTYRVVKNAFSGVASSVTGDDSQSQPALTQSSL